MCPVQQFRCLRFKFYSKIGIFLVNVKNYKMKINTVEMHQFHKYAHGLHISIL